MDILEALRKVTESIKAWTMNKFVTVSNMPILNKNLFNSSGVKFILGHYCSNGTQGVVKDNTKFNLF